MRGLIVVLALGLPVEASGADHAIGLDGWKPLESRFFQNAKRAECASRGASGDWSVRPQEGRVVAVARTRRVSQEPTLPVPGTVEFSGRRAVLERPDGVWLGIDRTELGGGLWWLARSGAPPERVSHENVRDIVLVDGRVTALSGLAFIGWDQGALLQPERSEDGSWRLTRIVPLGAAPQAHHLEPVTGALWIVTNRAIVKFDGRELTRIHQGRYRTFEPDSIARDRAGRIFIGMRHLVVRLSPARKGFHEDWLVPPWCTNVDLETCACRPGRKLDS